MNSLDPLVRRAPALQQTRDVADGALHMNGHAAHTLGLVEGEHVRVQAGDGNVTLPVGIDDRVPDGCVLVHAAQRASVELGPWYGPVTLKRD